MDEWIYEWMNEWIQEMQFPLKMPYSLLPSGGYLVYNSVS